MSESNPIRWEIGFRNIVAILIGSRKEFEIPEIVELVRVALAERDALRLDRERLAEALDKIREAAAAHGCGAVTVFIHTTAIHALAASRPGGAV